MLYFPRWKVWGITLLCALGVLLAVPSLLPAQAREALPGWAQAVKINLGLDLAGGSHLLLEAETPDVARQRLEAMEEIIRREMRRAGIGIRELSTSGGELSFTVRDPAQVDEAARIARNQAQPVGFSGSPDWDVAHRGRQPDRHAPDAGRHRPGRRAGDGQSPATSSTAGSTPRARSSRRSSARARTGSSSRSPASRIPRR